MPNWIDKTLLAVAPQWALSRVRARAQADIVARHFEAAAVGRRTQNWSRYRTDANAASRGALVNLRASSRDLVRNNAWAKRAVQVIAGNTVGWGITPKPTAGNITLLNSVWKKWAETTACDADGRLTFTAMERQILISIIESGEVLIRRRLRRPEDGLPIPLQLQVLEADFIDHSKDNIPGLAGGRIVQGIEYDAIGRRVAYHLFAEHPGSGQFSDAVSRRVPASEILHIYRQDRPGQVHGIPWFAPVLLKLRDFDEYEDATLMKQKIAACLTAFVTDIDGGSGILGEQSSDDPLIETLEPGLINYLPAGKQVAFNSPPAVNDHASFSTTMLRAVAAGLGVTYEDLTNDYSQVNFSSARMARLAHWSNVYDWQWNMLIPQLCAPVWLWFLDGMYLAGLMKPDTTPAVWTPPPMPMIEPDKEGVALSRLVRAGAMTHDEMVRQQGGDPDAHWAEYAAGLKTLDKLGIKLDSDVRAVSQAGLTQERAGIGGNAQPSGNGEQKPPTDPPAKEADEEPDPEDAKA